MSLSRYPGALYDPGPAGISAWGARQSLITSGEGAEIVVPPAVVSAPLNTEALYADARELTQSLYDLGSSVSVWRPQRRPCGVGFRPACGGPTQSHANPRVCSPGVPR